jgi:phosphotransferase system enzyme I (PtsP)
MQAVADPYLRERMADFDDLARRLLLHLAGGDGRADIQRPVEFPQDIVVVAHSMGPAELLDYDRRRLRALLLEEGAAHAHVAIVARALEIPVLGRLRGLLERVEANDLIIVDGDHAQVFIRPGEDVQQIFSQSFETRKQRQRAYARLRDLPAVTRDGVRISLNINAGLLIDVPHLHESGADGIGLYRTEIPFMVRSDFPDVAAQTELYRRVLSLAGDKPVVFRTLDVGGDKVLPYWRGEAEENPAMGWRAIRIGLDRPLMLRQQLRALIRACAGRPLQVMFPMVSEVAEFVAARRVVDLELKRLRTAGKPVPTELRVGVMFEVPALAWQLKDLLARVDFLSVGSNDLRQFLFASDRGSPRIADRYDTLSSAMLGLLQLLVNECAAAAVPLSLCGEMAGQPLDAMALIGLGFRNLSMAPPAVGPVKTMVRSLDLQRLQTYLTGVQGSTAGSLRGRLRAFARDHNVAL